MKTSTQPRRHGAVLGALPACLWAAALGAACADQPTTSLDGGSPEDAAPVASADAAGARPDRPGVETTLTATVSCAGGRVTSLDGRLTLWFPPRPCDDAWRVRIEPAASAERPTAWRVDLAPPEPTTVLADVLVGADQLGLGGNLEVDAAHRGRWVPAELVTTSSGATLRAALTLPASLSFRFEPCREQLGAPRACGDGLACVVEASEPDGECGVPCRGDDECPNPLQCQRGRCRAVECDGPGDCLAPGTRCLSVEQVGLCVGDDTHPFSRARAARAAQVRGEAWPTRGAGCSARQRDCPVDRWDPALDFDPEDSTRSENVWWYGVRYENVLERFVPMAFTAEALDNAGIWAWGVRGDLGSRLGTAITGTVAFGGLTYTQRGISMKRMGDVPSEPIEAPVLRFRAPYAGLYDLRLVAVGSDGEAWTPEVIVRDVRDRERATLRFRATGPDVRDPWVLEALRVGWDEAIELSAPQRRAEAIGTRSFSVEITRHR